MTPTWKKAYPWIAAAVSNLHSVDELLRHTLGIIGTLYASEGLLWAGLVAGRADTPQVYATAGALTLFEGRIAINSASIFPAIASETPSFAEGIWRFHPQSLPDWLVEQQQSPQLIQLATGDVIVPVSNQTLLQEATLLGQVPAPIPLQLVLQLYRTNPPAMAVACADPSGLTAGLATSPQSTRTIQGWSQDELESILTIGTQLGLAYDALYWRQRLEQSRQQVALIGRIARLLNSSLNPDEIVGRIVAELGQGLQCDRSVLVDLRHSPVNILAVWDHPDRSLNSLPQQQDNPSLWRSVVEMFLQGGASHLQLNLTASSPDPVLEWLHELGARSVLMVPLFTQDEFFGTVVLLSYIQERVYLVDELQTIRQVADQAAIALTNAQHYQSLWHRKEALRLQNRSLQREVVLDDLTQVMNRRSLERELEQLSIRSSWAVQETFSIIVCDIDYFKLVNDTHGHRIGDEVLQTLAQRLQRQLRRETSVYRYGGEEFVVILMATELAKAVDVAERLRQAIRSTPIQTSVVALQITASFGVAQQDLEQDSDAWSVLYRADQALYEAKRQGRDQVKAL